MTESINLLRSKRLKKIEYSRELTDSPNIIAKFISSIVKPDIETVGENYRYTEPQLNIGNKKKIDKKIRDELKEFLTGEFLRYLTEIERVDRKTNTSYTGDYYIIIIKNKLKNNKRYQNNIVRELREHL